MKDASGVTTSLTLMGFHSECVLAAKQTGTMRTSAPAAPTPAAAAAAPAVPAAVVQAAPSGPSSQRASVPPSRSGPGSSAGKASVSRHVPSHMHHASISHSLKQQRVAAATTSSNNLNTSRLRPFQEEPGDAYYGLHVTTDLQAVANSSVGGNGLPRPYGRFLSTRKGDGLAMFERMPGYTKIDTSKKHYPAEAPDPLLGAPQGSVVPPTVTEFNIDRREWGARNAKTDRYQIPMKYVRGGVDTLTGWEGPLRNEDKFARKRPDAYTLGNPKHGYTSGLAGIPVVDHEGGEKPSMTSGALKHVSSTGATFLVNVPKEIPPSVKVDDPRDFERAFLHPLRGYEKGRKIMNNIRTQDVLAPVE